MTYTYSSHPYSQDFNVKTFDNLRLEGSFTCCLFNRFEVRYRKCCNTH